MLLTGFTHRNSQKRIYLDDAVYFVTFRTYGNYPYFNVSANPYSRFLCDIFMENLKITQRLKKFELFAYNLLYDHSHLLLKPAKEYNLSKIMQSLKQNVSCDINRVLCATESEKPAFRFQEIGRNKGVDYGMYRKLLLEKYGNKYSNFPIFRWQRSFHDHIIRNEQDFENHWRYVAYNHQKHGLPEDWGYTSLNYLRKAGGLFCKDIF